MISQNAMVKPANDGVIEPLQIMVKSSKADQVSAQADAYRQKDAANTLVGGNYKKFFEIIFLNKKHIIHSHREEDAINIFLKNTIFKRDNILKIKQIESVSNNKNKKNIIFKDKNYQLYIVRGFKKGVFVKI